MYIQLSRAHLTDKASAAWRETNMQECLSFKLTQLLPLLISGEISMHAVGSDREAEQQNIKM
jgi:hypothetical protein